MKIALFGDVVGRPGREAVLRYLPEIRKTHALDFVVLNAENAAGGFGLTASIAEEFFDAGVDCITLGNHSWDQREMLTHIEKEPRIIRPLNFPNAHETPGRGAYVYTLPDQRRVGVVQVQCNLFMPQMMDSPFSALDQTLPDMALGEVTDALIVDVHGEATSEKMALGHHCDGRASLIVGTHTHVPTSDHMILPHGSGYQTDAGMCGDYHSVVGMRADISLAKFRTQIPTERNKPAEGKGTLSGVMVTLTPQGLASEIAPIRKGGVLSAA